MIQYIYFVKCPNCEDEPFDFFEEAKEFALGCLSNKPIITQIEVNRNDFGECTDSCDLGTVWSWEDMMNETDTEAAKCIFTRDDLKDYIPDEDSEFNSIDNSVDFDPEISEVSAIDEIPDNFRKPIPEGMTIEQLVEEMEEHEDQVECAGCEELFPKEECIHKEGIGYLCGDCEDSIVKCTWCEELYDRSECRYEVDLGWLCSRCEAGIKSRGETLTFREGNYWDFLDEDFGDARTLAEVVKDSINHLTVNLGKDPWADSFADDVIKDIETNYDAYVPEDIEHYNHWCSAVACEVSRQVNNPAPLDEAATSVVKQEFNPRETVEFEYKDLTILVQGPKRDVDDWDEAEHTDDYTYKISKDDVATAIWENFLTEEDVTDVPGGFATLEDDTAWKEFLSVHFDDLFEKYHDQLLTYFREAAIEAFETGYSWDDYVTEYNESTSFLEELEDSASYHNRLAPCPECGSNQSFDHETGICINCGFNV